MARCGPWGGPRQVGLAVSGGADSLALALLVKGWGRPTAFVVDHALRAESAAEAAWTVATLRGWGMPAHVLRLDSLRLGPALAERARAARHAALERACAVSGLVDLLYGHHAGDQAETVLMRRDRGSGPAGLAGMATVAEGDQVRRVRPLLGLAPGRLRATLAAAGQSWVEDPSNANASAGRTIARQRIGGSYALAAEAVAAGVARARQDRIDAAELAQRVTFYPAGYALLSPGPVGAGALAALLRTVAGGRYPVSGVAALAQAPRAATLGGARLLPGGRHGAGWLVVREEGGIAPPVQLEAGAVWDGRFRVTTTGPAGCTLGRLGDDAAAFRNRAGPPSAVLRTLPAIRYDGTLCHVPHLAYARSGWDTLVGTVRGASLPAACAAFLA